MGHRSERIRYVRPVLPVLPRLLTGSAAAYAPQNEMSAVFLLLSEALAALRVFKLAGEPGGILWSPRQKLKQAFSKVGAVHERWDGSLRLDHSASKLAGLVEQPAWIDPFWIPPQCRRDRRRPVQESNRAPDCAAAAKARSKVLTWIPRTPAKARR